MNAEELREYCLQLGNDVEEKMPFGAFKTARGVLAFYVSGHIFCYFDIDHFDVVTLKCRPECIDTLREEHEEVGPPYNMNPKHWIGVHAVQAPHDLTRRLVAESYQLVKSKSTPKKQKA